MSVEVVCGDSREVLPTLAGLHDRARVVVYADPPWPGCEHVDIDGALDAVPLWRQIAARVPDVASRMLVHLGALSDPRDMLDAVPRSLPFSRSVRLAYSPPMFRDVWIVDCDTVHAFGYAREHLPEGRTVYSGFCDTNKRGNLPRARTRHPCSRNLEHMRWVARWYFQHADLVIDPCCGSGTTLVACAELGINAIGIDTDRRWVDEARERVAAAESQGRLFA